MLIRPVLPTIRYKVKPFEIDSQKDVERFLKELMVPPFLNYVKEKAREKGLEDNVVTIEASGKYEKEDKKEEEGVTYHTRRFAATDYHRGWQLPTGVGEITSTYKNGVLEVTIPKPEEEEKEVKYIDVKVE